MKKNNYILKFHRIFIERMLKLIKEVERLYALLPSEEYKQHELVKLLARISRAYLESIPANPNLPDYYLRGTLAKFRRYKRGLQRYRLLFCFSNNPPIIAYLYINNKDHLRKTGDKNDPYEEFIKLIENGVFSHDPSNPDMQKWIRNQISL